MFNTFRYNLGKARRRFGLGQPVVSDKRIQNMNEAVAHIGGIHFKIEKFSSGEWTAESTNINGIITGGKNFPHDVNAQIKDAVFTYFEIPPELCDDSVLREQGKIAEQKIFKQLIDWEFTEEKIWDALN